MSETKLTPAEEALIPVIRDEWLKHGMSTDRMNVEAAKDAVNRAYAEVNLAPPEDFIVVGSPISGAAIAAFLARAKKIEEWFALRDKIIAKVGDNPKWWLEIPQHIPKKQLSDYQNEVRNQVGRAIWGQHEADWFAFYDFFLRSRRVDGLEKLVPMMDAAKAMGWWWSFEEVAVLTDRPVRLLRDQAGRLHHDEGAALLYPDGWGVYAWHGIRIPPNFIEEREKITADQIERERNAEMRRILLEIYGFGNYIEARNAKVIDKDASTQKHEAILYAFKVPGDETETRVLSVWNGTLEPDGRRRRFFLGVPETTKTAAEAIAWTYGLPAKSYKEAVRT